MARIVDIENILEEYNNYKSFTGHLEYSELKYFTREQMLLLKDIVDSTVNEMNRNNNN